MDKRFLGILGAIIIIFVGIFVVSQNSSNGSSNTGSNAAAKPTNHIEGKGQKGVTLIEYGDYQCPVCEGYYLPLQEVYAKYSNDIYFQFRNLPLIQVHPNAFAGARAAEAAELQNKYWQMHDALYEQNNWQDWTNSTNPQNFFNAYAQQIGLNVNQFKQDYASGKVNDVINADVKEFDKSKLDHATPTFFLDGKYISNTQVSDPTTGQPSVDKFSQLLDAEIAKKTSPANQ